MGGDIIPYICIYILWAWEFNFWKISDCEFNYWIIEFFYVKSHSSKIKEISPSAICEIEDSNSW